ncbi:MAG: 50S ribosomal protein L24 [Alphaproteobacteria bacterium]|nr:50S ribosomal protein L24 [Alphaproteobacteria bacterium]MCK5360574.1 50S ribosomal protein L24 [Gammaproteobacteria bacterium]
MAVKMKIRKGDRVVVLTGKDKGKTGSILRVITKDERVVVQGVNLVKRHTRADRVNAGGIIDKEAPLHISNVAHVDPKTGKPTRVGYKFIEPKGKGEKPTKIRFARRSGEVIDS